jgi:hypothetical protein
MRSTIAQGLHVLHTVPGRLRVRLPDAPESRHREIEAGIRRVPGVTGARANVLTGNILIHFDTRVLDQASVLVALDAVRREAPGAREALPPAIRKRLSETPPAVVRSVTRTGSAALGVALLGARCLAGKGSTAAVKHLAAAAGGVALAESFPLLRERLRGLLGRNVADLLFLMAGLLGNVLTTSPLGLAAAGAEALLLLLLLLSRRTAPGQPGMVTP